MDTTLELIFRPLVAGLLGAIIGLDRAYRAKEAGFRTHFLVSLGSALFMLVSQYGFSDVLQEGITRFDPARVAAQVVSGIGFIGAGTIIIHRQFVRGLTTAAGLWATAGIGLAIYVINLLSAVLLPFFIATTFCSLDYARKVGARLLPDTIDVNGAGRAHGFFGVIDSIRVGEIVFRNAEVVCVDDNMVMDSLLTGDFVIGLDFMKLCGEVQFYPQEGRIVFPASPTPLPETGHNIYLTEDNGLRLEAYAGDERLKMMFDTGNHTTTFSASYYARHKQYIDKAGTRTTRLSGGIGKVGMKTLVLLPPLTVQTGGADVRLDKACVDFEPNHTLSPDDGNAGLDIIQNCRKATLNLKDLFLKIEN